MNKTTLYTIIVLVALVIVVSGWYVFSAQGMYINWGGSKPKIPKWRCTTTYTRTYRCRSGETASCSGGRLTCTSTRTYSCPSGYTASYSSGRLRCTKSNSYNVCSYSRPSYNCIPYGYC